MGEETREQRTQRIKDSVKKDMARPPSKSKERQKQKPATTVGGAHDALSNLKADRDAAEKVAGA